MALKSTSFGVGLTSLLALLGTSLLAAYLAHPSAAQSQGLQPVAPPAGPGTPTGPNLVAPAPAPTQAGPSWREELTQLDLAQRTLAFDRAVEAARTDPALRDSLQAWADDPSQPELAWTAHLVLHLAADSHDPNPFGAPFFRRPSLPGFDDDLFESFFRGFDSNPFGGSPFAPNTGQSQGQSFSMETGPDGVKVLVETSGPSGTETQEYTAESLDELRTTHPELFVDGGPLGSLQMGTRTPFGGLTPFFGRGPAIPGAPQVQGGLQPVVPWGTTRTDVLGVMVREEAEGLRVLEVLPGTIAASVGLEPGDLVLGVGGKRVRTTLDVRAALEARAPAGAVIVEWLDEEGRAQSATWDPPAGS